MPPTATPLPTRLLTMRDLVQLLGRSLATLHRDRHMGRLPAPLRIGQSVRWDPREIEAWLAAGCPSRQEWEARRKAGKTA